MNKRRALASVLFLLLAALALLQLPFFFDCADAYHINSNHRIRGFLLLGGISLLLEPFVHRKPKLALAAQIGILAVLASLENNYYLGPYNLNTISLKFRYALDYDIAYAITKAECLVFPDTYFCNIDDSYGFKTVLSWPATFLVLAIFSRLARAAFGLLAQPLPAQPNRDEHSAD